MRDVAALATLMQHWRIIVKEANMTGRLLIAVIAVFGLTHVQAQADDSVQVGTIIVFAETHDMRFLNIEDESFISWTDLVAALPGFFVINSSGQIELTAELVELLLLGAAASANVTGGPVPTGQVIESRIDGEFDGWEGDTIFHLQNGQIWQQAEYSYRYSYRYSPRVTIVQSGGGWVMSVEGISDTIRVRRIR